MRITFCGTASGVFTGQRASSGLILQHESHMVMLDCGPGSLQGALRAGIKLHELEAVVLSHLHLDHVLDLAGLPFLNLVGAAPVPPVWGPPGTLGAVEATAAYLSALTAAAAAPIHNAPPPRRFAAPQVTEISETDEREICGFVVRSNETPHAPGVIAAARRFAADHRVLVFSGDTQPNPGTLVPLSAQADVLVHECFSLEGLERAAAARPAANRDQLRRAFTSTHTEVRQAAAIARDAGVRRLVLTHLLPEEDPFALQVQASAIFAGEIYVGHDGLVLEV